MGRGVLGSAVDEAALDGVPSNDRPVIGDPLDGAAEFERAIPDNVRCSLGAE